MPRGNKSKGRSRAKHQQARGESQDVQAARHTTEEDAASFPLDQGASVSSPDTCTPQQSQEAKSSGCSELAVECTGYELGAEGSYVGAEGSDVGAEGSDVGAEGSDVEVEEKSSCALASASIMLTRRDPLSRKATELMDFVLEKFKTKEFFTEADMLRVINRRYKGHFEELLKRISMHLELVFGLELKDLDPQTQSYMLLGKLGLSTEGIVSNDSGLPKTGLLITLLPMIFTKGNHASEGQVWELLRILGIYPGRNHVIWGESKKFITKDLVQENYLMYRKGRGSNPPGYEFLWGPRAYAVTTKMKVLENLAKITDTHPSSFPKLYEEALKDEEERASRRVTVVRGNVQ